MTLKIKQGETFILTGQYTEDDGVTPKSLAGVTLSSQIRTKQCAVVATLDITAMNNSGTPGLYQMAVPDADGTLLWPVGTLYWDIRETSGGVTRLTDTRTITVLRAETRV